MLEPVFEADMLSCSYGFRPKRGAHDGLQVLIDESWRGRRWVVETDIANCFEAIPIEELMQAVQERVCDQSVLKLLRVILRAGVMEDGRVRRSVTGTPQGGVVSPLLANVYLHRIDRAWDVREHGVLVRYADLCRARHKSASRSYDSGKRINSEHTTSSGTPAVAAVRPGYLCHERKIGCGCGKSRLVSRQRRNNTDRRRRSGSLGSLSNY